jgi:integrase
MLATVAASHVPLEDFAAELLQAYAPPLVSIATHRKMRDALQALMRLPGVETTADLTPATMAALEADMTARDLAPMTMETHRSHLRTACRFAVQRGYLGNNPVRSRRPHVSGPRAGRLFGRPGGAAAEDRDAGPDPDAVARLLAHLIDASASWEAHRLFVLVATIAYAGLRRNEALGLEWDQYDPGSRCLNLPGRPIGSRRPTVPPFLADALDQWRPRCGAPWVFPGAKRKGPWLGGPRGQKPLCRLHEAAEAAGSPGLTFEALRAFWRAHRGRVSLPDVEARTPPADRSRGPVLAPPGPRPGGFAVLALADGPNRPPRVRGVPLERHLSPREFAILRAMVDAGCHRGARLTEAELADASGRRSPVRDLRELRKLPQLADVILFPGAKGAGGYGLADR